MADELNLEAERTAFEAKYPVPAHTIRCGDGYATTSYNAWDSHKFMHRWEGWVAARRAAPIAAQLDADLPPLPSRTYHWNDLELYERGDVRKYTTDAIAPYAERIRQMNEDLEKLRTLISIPRAQKPAKSIGDDLDFRGLLRRYRETDHDGAAAREALIAYIDGRTAGTASEAAPDPAKLAIERRAKEIYAGFDGAARFPWQNGGNSLMQDKARKMAEREFAAAPSLSGTEDAK